MYFSQFDQYSMDQYKQKLAAHLNMSMSTLMVRRYVWHTLKIMEDCDELDQIGENCIRNIYAVSHEGLVLPI